MNVDTDWLPVVIDLRGQQIDTDITTWTFLPFLKSFTAPSEVPPLLGHLTPPTWTSSRVCICSTKCPDSTCSTSFAVFFVFVSYWWLLITCDIMPVLFLFYLTLFRLDQPPNLFQRSADLQQEENNFITLIYDVGFGHLEQDNVVWMCSWLCVFTWWKLPSTQILPLCPEWPPGAEVCLTSGTAGWFLLLAVALVSLEHTAPSLSLAVLSSFNNNDRKWSCWFEWESCLPLCRKLLMHDSFLYSVFWLLPFVGLFLKILCTESFHLKVHTTGLK